ncbi:MAG: DUF3267 domain-containing protein [Peptococcus niger]
MPFVFRARPASIFIANFLKAFSWHIQLFLFRAAALSRFIFISLAPALLLGVVPLVIWSLSMGTGIFVRSCLPFGAALLFGAVGDFYNVANTLRQVPSDAKVQLSGWHSYWLR